MPPIGVNPGSVRSGGWHPSAPPPPSVGGGFANLAHSLARSGAPSVGRGLPSVARSAATSAPYHSVYRPSLPPERPGKIESALGAPSASQGRPAGTRLWGIGGLPLSGQVKAIHDLLSKGGYMQYASATGQDPWKLLYKDSNTYDRQTLTAIRRSVTYAQALRNFTRQGITPEQAQSSADAKAYPSFRSESGQVPFGYQRSSRMGGDRAFT